MSKCIFLRIRTFMVSVMPSVWKQALAICYSAHADSFISKLLCQRVKQRKKKSEMNNYNFETFTLPVHNYDKLGNSSQSIDNNFNLFWQLCLLLNVWLRVSDIWVEFEYEERVFLLFKIKKSLLILRFNLYSIIHIL